MSIGDIMANIHSERAKSLLQKNKFFETVQTPGMKRYPNPQWDFWAGLEVSEGNVKNLSFFGRLEEWKKVLLQSMASIMVGKSISQFDQVTLRECEAYLRDKNSETAIQGLPKNAEAEFKEVLLWLRTWNQTQASGNYHFSSEKGPFRNLKLTDKVRELKAFLNSDDIISLYQNHARPELLDVEELTVYLNVPYETEREKALLDELHALGVATFQEENLNFIPEA